MPLASDTTNTSISISLNSQCQAEAIVSYLPHLEKLGTKRNAFISSIFGSAIEKARVGTNVLTNI